MATYSVGQILNTRNTICEETGEEVFEFSPTPTEISMQTWNGFFRDRIKPISVNVLPEDIIPWLKKYQAFFDASDNVKEEFDPFAAFENMADQQESRNGNDYC